MENQTLHVNIGQVKVGCSTDVLKATLGSCVGIAFLWKTAGLCGLAHCLLPEAPSHNFNISGRFVSQAIPSLMALMRIRVKDIPQIEVHVIGGGNMMSHLARKNTDHVGQKNVETAIKFLEQAGFTIKAFHVGGDLARQVTVDCHNHVVAVHNIKKEMPEGAVS